MKSQNRRFSGEYYPDAGTRHVYFYIEGERYLGLPTSWLEDYLKQHSEKLQQMEILLSEQNSTLDKFRLRTGGRKRKLSSYDVEQIKAYLQKGYSIRKISEMYEVTHGTIINYLKRDTINESPTIKD